MSSAVVIGGGPAGLMAAEELARAGHSVTLAEAKPTLARKFLMAGKSGLNLTRDEPLPAFLSAYGCDWLEAIVADFGPDQVQDFARGLGVDLFTGTTGRVFPVEMKASPMLRAWIARLTGMGVQNRTRWRWTGWHEGALCFETSQGARQETPDVTVLALGGASWPRLGSDAAWVPWLVERGVRINPFQPANMGFVVDWSPHMAPFFGQPVKGAALSAAGRTSRGEFIISARGIEGGGVYAISAPARDGAALTLDLMPGRSVLEVTGRLARPRGKDSVGNWLRKSLRLDPIRLALLQEWGRPLPTRPDRLAALIKALPVRHAGPRPLAEAISSAGGIAAESLGAGLELTCLPGVFACGEMLDWEAPTGGYLLTACLATGRHAGRAAAKRLAL